MTEHEYRRCSHCGKNGLGKTYGRIRSSNITWICPNCGEQEIIRR